MTKETEDDEDRTGSTEALYISNKDRVIKRKHERHGQDKNVDSQYTDRELVVIRKRTGYRRHQKVSVRM